MSTVGLHWPTRSHATRPLLRTAGVAGLLMLPLFAATVVVLTWLEWDFLHGLGWTVVHAHDVNYPSSLARGDLGRVQSLNFAVLGLLTVLFARGLRTQFVRRRSGVAASGAFGAAALGGLLSVFPTDLPGEPATWHGLLHGVGFVLLMLGNPVANAPAAILVTVALFPFDQVSFYAAIVVMLAYYGVLGLRMRRLAGHTDG
jgi:hypothetical protein